MVYRTAREKEFLVIKVGNREVSVSMIGALPPMKGNAYYSKGLACEVAKAIPVEFFAFKKMYPEFLYPGGVEDRDVQFVVPEITNLQVRRLLHFANPFSWVRVGFLATGNVVHAQWWSIPLAPIYVVTLAILRLRRIPIVVTVHNVIPHETSTLDRIATKLVLSLADKFIVHSEDNKKELVALFGMPANNVHKVHMPDLWKLLVQFLQ